MEKPEKFKFIIFDLDGVIFDSKKIWKKHGVMFVET